MNKEVLADQNSKQVDELREDIIVVGPGQMLSEARRKLSLSEEDIAEKLNFKKSLVSNIEQDIFDQKLPATFNRGYLRSYAKLVNVDLDDVLSAYDMLGVAEVQRSEMQSFSNLTEKQAEHSRLMWLSYLIAAILFGLMVLWWLQAPETDAPEKVKPVVEKVLANVESAAVDNQVNQQVDLDNQAVENNKKTLSSNTLPQEALVKVAEVLENNTLESNPEEQVVAVLQPLTQGNIEEAQQALDISTAVFTFSGDCWVNIYDATD